MIRSVYDILNEAIKATDSLKCEDAGLLYGCRECCNSKVEHKELQLCASCNKSRRAREKAKQKPDKKRKPLKRFSDKRKDENEIYSERRLKFLEGKECVVYGTEATTVHHAKGRYGYADNWARDNNIPLLLDERWWIPASFEGHQYIELHPSEAKEKGWSLSRLENLDQEKVTI